MENENGVKRLLNAKELQEYTGIGKGLARKFGKDIGAEVRIGGRVVYDKEAIDKYIESHRGEEKEK